MCGPPSAVIDWQGFKPNTLATAAPYCIWLAGAVASHRAVRVTPGHDSLVRTLARRSLAITAPVRRCQAPEATPGVTTTAYAECAPGLLEEEPHLQQRKPRLKNLPQKGFLGKFHQQRAKAAPGRRCVDRAAPSRRNIWAAPCHDGLAETPSRRR